MVERFEHDNPFPPRDDDLIQPNHAFPPLSSGATGKIDKLLNLPDLVPHQPVG